ncbi:MAG: ribosome-binding factor A [Proteobacteria bacterium]|nr:ribosome-binding factor A [Pseudomonadota bacterium]
MKQMSPRQHKVAKEVQHLAATALLQGRIHSTLPLHRITVVDCWISADLRLARLYLETPQGANQPEFIEQANLQLAKPLRKYLAENLATRNAPSLTFVATTDDPFR